jgi:hypothetical protein
MKIDPNRPPERFVEALACLVVGMVALVYLLMFL